MTAEAQTAARAGRFRATYRVQFNDNFTFADAERLAPYLAALGISHLYASPIFAARAGSAHGYDMVDPTRISDALGGEAGFRRLAAALRAKGIGIILDIVPNHMAADAANPYWMDVLEFGKAAASAGVFDIDFSRPIALPWVGDDVSEPIESLRLDAAAGRIEAVVAGNGVPLRPASVALLLDRIGALEAAEAFRSLEAEADEAAIAAARAALRTAAAAAPDAFARALQSADLTALHTTQHWRAVPWRRTEALNYRRFFEVSHLVGVRAEDPAVFEMVHRLPLALVREGLVQGLRVDHIDGLCDPAGYAGALRDAAGEDTLILIEKILGRDEPLRDWPIDGTTGYERLNLINAAFVSARGRARLQRALEDEGLIEGSPERRLFDAKHAVLDRSFRPELARLADRAAKLPGLEAVPRGALTATLAALLAAFPVYRSYIDALPASLEDEALWREALRRLEHLSPGDAAAAGQIVEAALGAGGEPGDLFRTAFQQLSGPAMAKGYEDTELYRSVALTSVNEVGSDLGAETPAGDALHASFAAFSLGGQTPLATHDTKRGADTRARLNLLSHDPEDWLAHVKRWRERHAGLKQNDAPDALDEWLIYQTLFAAWPITTERARGYFEKALREAKRHGSWTDPDTAYEEALHGFVAELIEGEGGADFRSDIEALHQRLAADAARFGLGQTVLQLTLPGIPDIYRGTELADLSLVDPDNRRPVDWERRIALAEGPLEAAPAGDREGVAKLAAIRALLALRAAHPALFAAPYEAVPLRQEGWFAFKRVAEEGTLFVALPVTPAAARATALDTGTALRDGDFTRVLPPEGTVSVAGGRLAIDPDHPVTVLAHPGASSGPAT
ncbi:malto-oligosyltrehalose synthase [Kaistia geumhonensis]|uniref:(1->4)-alpha-D-glucan 1-alpha-D-glucosylmutase n=1 Tax=Kaistia geumhonensis TaxID=410839 RepID=A0ABU0M9R6_9HYPH|nr:malto-oligosyltrehalose synthase [Kaistia geumhonensis]MCX5480584.1 malto-oligosyltrehalose synthase [Kaistia geumhonensis]MDQ0517714.1 (1->4)-alpha-D-glucan 1-alpha-D-glucosylmutase [Kaistia geumhonensis]